MKIQACRKSKINYHTLALSLLDGGQSTGAGKAFRTGARSSPRKVNMNVEFEDENVLDYDSQTDNEGIIIILTD